MISAKKYLLLLKYLIFFLYKSLLPADFYFTNLAELKKNDLIFFHQIQKNDKSLNLQSFLQKHTEVTMGKFTSKRTVIKMGISFLAKDFQKDFYDFFTESLFSSNFYINDRALKQAAIKNLKLINSYRGLRHKKGLPVRGQRTHTNAKTRRKRGVC